MFYPKIVLLLHSKGGIGIPSLLALKPAVLSSMLWFTIAPLMSFLPHSIFYISFSFVFPRPWLELHILMADM